MNHLKTPNAAHSILSCTSLVLFEITMKYIRFPRSKMNMTGEASSKPHLPLPPRGNHCLRCWLHSVVFICYWIRILTQAICSITVPNLKSSTDALCFLPDDQRSWLRKWCLAHAHHMVHAATMAVGTIWLLAIMTPTTGLFYSIVLRFIQDGKCSSRSFVFTL